MIKVRCGCGATCEVSYRDNQFGEEREREVLMGWLAGHKCVEYDAPEDNLEERNTPEDIVGANEEENKDD